MNILNHVAWREIDGTVIVLNCLSHSSEYYLMENLARDIWLMLVNNYDKNEIVNEIVSKYDVESKEVVENDVKNYLQKLIESELICNNKSTIKYAKKNLLKNRLYTDNKLIDDFMTRISGKYILKCTLELTYSCNQKCKHCYAESPIKNKDILKSVI